jgi:pimeloyl-ACP methyl ester carboxylesterase
MSVTLPPLTAFSEKKEVTYEERDIVMSNIMNSATPEASATLVPDAASIKRPHQPFRRTRRWVWRGLGLLALIGMVILAAFGPFPWQILGQATLLLSVVVVVLLTLGALLIMLGVTIFTRTRTRILPWTQRLVRLSLVLLILLVGMGGAVIGSQWHASTPPILSANGQPLPGSIATMEQVTLGDSQQWITIRGKNIHNPVLLFLMGGPGAGGFPDNSLLLTPSPLEDHFVVVNWDQPGTGKSSNAVPIAALTPQRYVSDAYALTQMLRARFHQDKIYVFGSSWGTILGIKLVQQHPDLFYAYIGQGQMVNTTENDIMGYQFALKFAAEQGDSATVETLRQNGPPPYTGDSMAWKYAAYLDVLNRYMGALPILQTLQLAAALTPEYGLLDKATYVRSFFDVFTVVYPQLQDLDFTTQANKLEVPVYFFEGRKDVSAMTSLVERYYHVLQAPHKELIWSNSGHSSMDENQFMDVMLNHVLKQTWPETGAHLLQLPVMAP